jgi:hypothetical protein
MFIVAGVWWYKEDLYGKTKGKGGMDFWAETVDEQLIRPGGDIWYFDRLRVFGAFYARPKFPNFGSINPDVERKSKSTGPVGSR